MSFRTLELTEPTELHIKNGQLKVTQEAGEVMIPIEDLSLITAIGPNIRLSPRDLSILTQNHVSVMTLDEKYLPTAVVLPFEGNARQSQIMHQQVSFPRDKYLQLWKEIIFRKISNQACALALMGRIGSDYIAHYAELLDEESVDQYEAVAAKEYFQFYHEGLNRRTDDPINSRLNYGYAIVRSAIARGLCRAGFHLTFGIHHDNQLNAFNLADDLIEPFRPMVDLVAASHIGRNIKRNKAERKSLIHVLYNACMVNELKINVLSAIELMCESLKRIVGDSSEERLTLLHILPVESLEGITE